MIGKETLIEKYAQVDLDKIVARHGMPLNIISDRDTRFTSHFLGESATWIGISSCSQYNLSSLDIRSDRENNPNSRRYALCMCLGVRW